MHLFFVTFREPPGSWMSNIQPRLAEAQRTKVIEAVVGKGVNLTQAPPPVISSRGVVVDSDILLAPVQQDPARSEVSPPNGRTRRQAR